jgi:hypothetical protein
MTAIRLGALLLLATLATAQQISDPKSAESSISEPKLPVIDYDACPGKGRIVPDLKIKQAERTYSSWQDKRVSIGTLKTGEEVTALAGVNVIREPDRALIKQSGVESLAREKGVSLKSGDVVFRYGNHADGYSDFWTRGVWYTEYWEEIVVKDGWCGFADKSECTVEIVKNGVREWWVQVKTSNGSTGWVLARKSSGDKTWSSGDFGHLCNAD